MLSLRKEPAQTALPPADLDRGQSPILPTVVQCGSGTILLDAIRSRQA